MILRSNFFKVEGQNMQVELGELTQITFPLEGLTTLKQVQQIFPVSKSAIYKSIREGKFPAPRKWGRSSLWDAKAVREALRGVGADMA
jgi:predicted DNA-binding transcriptional regulator AlpA